MSTIKYKAVKTANKSQAKQFRIYGIAAEKNGVEIKRIDNVFNRRQYIKHLVRICNTNAVTPSSVEYIIEDFK